MIDALIRIYRGIVDKKKPELFTAIGEFYAHLHARLTAIEDRLSALETPVISTPTELPTTSEPTTGFTDDFNYVVNRDGPVTEFMNHGWTRVKSLNNGDTRSYGYLYTVDLPDMGRCLALEAVEGGQTDYYLEKRMDYPLNLEINLTILIPDGPITSEKLIYPSPNGNYPVPGNSYPWLIDLRTSNFGWIGTDYEAPQDPNGPCYLLIEGSQMFWHKSPGDGPWKMMHTNPVPIRRNVPTDIRIRIDRSGTSNAGGTIDVDLREQGELVNVIHAHHGEMVDGSLFEWPLGNYDHISAIRIPTTQNNANIKYINRISFTEAV